MTDLIASATYKNWMVWVWFVLAFVLFVFNPNELPEGYSYGVISRVLGSICLALIVASFPALVAILIVLIHSLSAAYKLDPESEFMGGLIFPLSMCIAIAFMMIIGDIFSPLEHAINAICLVDSRCTTIY